MKNKSLARIMCIARDVTRAIVKFVKKHPFRGFESSHQYGFVLKVRALMSSPTCISVCKITCGVQLLSVDLVCI